MGKKYIIELEEKPFHKDGDFLYRVKGFNSLVFDMTGIGKLTPYTEPDLEQVRKEAYDKGYDDAKGGYENGFENGMIVAWDAAKKIALMDTETSENVTGYFGLFRIMENLTPMQAIEKLKAYEQKHEEIKVGNEVKDDKGDIGVCTEISYPANSMHIMYADGTATDISLTGVTKTGRNFPEIAAVLQNMRG